MCRHKCSPSFWKTAVVVEVPRLKYISQSHITIFAQGVHARKPLLRLYDFTVCKIYQLIFNDCLMFNEEIQSALCKFHLLFYYWNLSYINVGREKKAAV